MGCRGVFGMKGWKRMCEKKMVWRKFGVAKLHPPQDGILIIGVSRSRFLLLKSCSRLCHSLMQLLGNKLLCLSVRCIIKLAERLSAYHSSHLFSPGRTGWWARHCPGADWGRPPRWGPWPPRRLDPDRSCWRPAPRWRIRWTPEYTDEWI